MVTNVSECVMTIKHLWKQTKLRIAVGKNAIRKERTESTNAKLNVTFKKNALMSPVMLKLKSHAIVATDTLSESVIDFPKDLKKRKKRKSSVILSAQRIKEMPKLLKLLLLKMKRNKKSLELITTLRTL